jgi:hypothetical protein
MSDGLWLPTAERDPHGRALSYTDTGEPKGCLHTTETSAWPTYRGWTVHPHLTVKPIPHKGIEVRQHVPLDRASFSLRNLDGGAQTNRDRVVQVELIGTCDPARAGELYYWHDADDVVLRALFSQVIAPLADLFGIPVRWPADRAYPASYGTRNDVRLTGPAFDAYSGWLGHEHVPENLHGDPGDFPWSRMVGPGTVTPPPVRPSWTEEIVKQLPTLRKGDDGAAVKRVQALLCADGPDVVIDGDYGPKTESAVKAAQKRHDVVVDGIVGATTWAELLGVR